MLKKSINADLTKKIQIEDLSSKEIRLIFHELQMHQIEFEMQNVQLRATQVVLETSQARYCDLYDLASVGYYTASKQGLILEANLKAATLLGSTRIKLAGQPISPGSSTRQTGVNVFALFLLPFLLLFPGLFVGPYW